MTATGIPVDVDVLRGAIHKTYTEVSTEQGKDFIFPTGRTWAQELGYPEPELSHVPEETAQSFAGVANPWVHGRIDRGQTVLDLGCGAGTDLLIAAQMVARGYTDIKQSELIDTYSRSKFEDTRRKAAKFGAKGSTISATKAQAISSRSKPSLGRGQQVPGAITALSIPTIGEV